ncbi:MAG: hypothetical protein KIS66_04710 [Fimbriimonadaceae bacterium]|nr:hypothetical protein [Fimbriimonadaceae bacterium]
MIRANVADVKARLSHYLRLAKSGQKVVICERNTPVAELTAVPRPVDRALRESAFGMFSFPMTDEEFEEALRPMTEGEADAFVEGRY